MPALDLSSYYTPHAVQAEIHRSTAKSKVLEMARRVGKSRAALWEMIRIYLKTLEPEYAVDRTMVPPFHAWVICPSYPQARQVWNELISFIPGDFIQPGGIHQDEHIIYLKGSPTRGWGLIEVKSAHDPDTLQTVGLDFLWVTESQDISDRAFQKVIPALRSKGRLGLALYEGIPALYPDHWFWRMCELAEHDESGAFFYKHATYQENPMMTEEDATAIEQDKALLPESVWRRMYLAERSMEAGYFHNVAACTYGDLLSMPLPGARYVAGLDLGRKVDPSVLTILDAQSRAVVYDMMWDADGTWPAQREGVARLCREWGVERIVVDATGMGGDIFTQELIEMNIPVESYIITHSSRDALLMGLAVALERQSVGFPPIKPLLRQLAAFQMRKTAGGNYRADAPPGEHDDYIFSLALGLTAADAPPNLMPTRASTGGNRYVPTWAEAQNGGLLTGAAKRRHEIALGKIAERHAQAGV